MTEGISNHLESAKLCVADWDLWLLRSRSLETFLTLLGGSQFQSLQFSSQLVIIFGYVDECSFWETFPHYSHPLLLHNVHGIYLYLFIAESSSLHLRPTMYPHLHTMRQCPAQESSQKEGDEGVVTYPGWISSWWRCWDHIPTTLLPQRQLGFSLTLTSQSVGKGYGGSWGIPSHSHL